MSFLRLSSNRKVMELHSPVSVSAGAVDANKAPVLEVGGVFHPSFFSTDPDEHSELPTSVNGLESGVTFVVGDMVCLKTNKVNLAAKAGTSDEAFCIGVLTYVSGADYRLQAYGKAVVKQSFTAGLKVYIDSAGGLTTTVPSASGEWLSCVGFTLGGNDILLNLEEPISIV